jgi:histidine triad (HIT) family protein
VLNDPYNPDNVFAKILRNEIPCKRIAEDAYSLAFYDAFPKAATHVLVIPKKPYVSFNDFATQATPEEIVSLTKMIQQVAEQLNLNTSGYRILSNAGKDAHQEVPHFHVHICGGEPLGPLLCK